VIDRNLSRTSSLFYLIWLWPLFFVFLIAQVVMRLTGNTAVIGIPTWISFLDFGIYISLFTAAAIWAQRPLAQWRKRLMADGARHARSAELVMSALPWRALKAFMIAGIVFSTYLLLLMEITSAVHGVRISLRVSAALGLTFFFGLAVVAPALAGAQSISYSAMIRRQLASKGLFLSNLETGQSMHATTKVAVRPWVIYVVTGLFPTILLALFVLLALGVKDEIERSFIFSQSIVLFTTALMAGCYIVFSTSRTLKTVAAELLSGLARLRNGEFREKVPVMIDDEFGMLARGLNTALEGLQDREDLKDSLRIATEIQQGLLPGQTPPVRGYAMLGFQQSCYAVGGDFYDYIQLPDNRLWLVIADVAGKGYPAALTVANLQAMLHVLAAHSIPLAEAASYINTTLCNTIVGGRFVTLFIATLDAENGSLFWLNAGHMPALFSQDSGVKSLPASSPPMGLIPDMKFEVQYEKITTGDVLFAYTDGVTDTLDRAGKEMFGSGRLSNWFSEHRLDPLPQMRDSLMAALAGFGKVANEDDMTILCLRREAR